MSTRKTVIHVHTNYSFDCNASPAELVDLARQRGVDCLAITDHDEIDGARAAREIGGVQIIVGEEVSSADGHIIGLFLQHRIPPGLSAEETVAQIRDQGGLVLAPHPFATLCDGTLGDAGLRRILPQIDAIEVFNAQNVLPWEDRRADHFARAHGLTPYVGVDAHIRGYLDASYQLLPPFDGPTSFLAALRLAELHRRRFAPGYFFHMGRQHLWQMILRRRLAGFGTNCRPELDPRRPRPSLAPETSS